MDPRFKAEYLEDKEGTLRELMSEAAALADRNAPSIQEQDHEEETPPPAKKAKGLAAILEENS